MEQLRFADSSICFSGSSLTRWEAHEAVCAVVLSAHMLKMRFTKIYRVLTFELFGAV